MASPMPVLPLVASITVCPGFNCPDCSAASMTPSASRSLTEPRGLKASILTNRFASGGASLLILTTGVLPTVSRMLLNRRPMGLLCLAWLVRMYLRSRHLMLEGDRPRGQPNTEARYVHERAWRVLPRKAGQERALVNRAASRVSALWGFNPSRKGPALDRDRPSQAS